MRKKHIFVKKHLSYQWVAFSVDKKPVQPRASGGDRNVKFSGESREERNNRRNREEGDRTLRNQGEFRRGPPGLV